MGFPAGMQLATAAFGIPLTATGKDVVTTVTVKPTARVIWAATGQPLPEFSDSFTAEAGQLGTFQVPFIDQAGFIDSTGATFTDWAYQITAEWRFGNERPITWSKNFKPLLAQTGTIDLDLVPDGAVSIPVTAPTAAVLGFHGRTGFITIQESDLPPRLSVGELAATYAGAEATTTALAGKVAKGELVINARDYGVIGDGVTDDCAALLTAANAAVALGYPMVIPSGFTCALGLSLMLPAGLRLNTNGAKFKMLAQTGRIPAIRIASNTTVTGGIYITTLGGVEGGGLQIQSATNVRMDVVDVESTIPAQGSGNVRDNGLNINGSSYVAIDRVRVKNFDYSIGVETVSDLSIGWVDVDTYVKAVWLRDTPHLRLNGGWIRGASPNSAYTPGHNGILIEATVLAEDIRINDVAVHNAGEHGFRTSGPAQIRNLWINNCSAINCTGTGFKVLGSLLSDGVYNENIFLVNLLAEDCGLVNSNTCGFLVQMAKYVKIVSPIVRNRNKTSSGHTGIRLGGVTHVQITDPDIKNASQYGIWADSEYGNVSDVKINGANIDQTSGWCVYLSCGQPSGTAINFNNIEIEATCSLTETAGGAFYAGRGAYAVDGTWTGFNRLTLRAHDNIPTTIASGLVAAVTASFFASITGKKNGTTIFRNGSTWLDTTTGNSLLAKAGAWVTL